MPQRNRPPQLSFPRNPQYGSGVARRRIELVGTPGRVAGHLVDPYHEMTCVLLHDGSRIVDVDGSTLRYPTTACPGATAVLRELSGTALAESANDYYVDGVISRHCTHLFDLAYLCVAHARRGQTTWVYEAVVPDGHDGTMTVEVRCNGALEHAWQVRDSVVVGPGSMSGIPLLRGFLANASLRMSGDALEAAIVLARTYLISLGRPYDAGAWAGLSLTRNPALLGRCYAYSAVRADASQFIPDYVREEWSRPDTG